MKKANMKIGCGTVLFREFELERALDAIRAAGFSYCETQGVGPWCNHVDIWKTDPVRFADLAKSYGFIEVTALWMPNGNMIANALSVDSAVRALEWADAAGIAVVNTGDGHKPDGMSDGEAMDTLRRRLDEIYSRSTAHARLAIEPHGTFSLTLAGLRSILELAPDGKLGVNYDAANINRAKYVESGAEGSGWKAASAAEDETDVLRGVVQKVVHCHAKDLGADGECVALGKGRVRLAECIEILKNAGYAGAVSVETEGGSDFDAICRLAVESREYLESLILKTAE